jgi:hypothetical protein
MWWYSIPIMAQLNHQGTVPAPICYDTCMQAVSSAVGRQEVAEPVVCLMTIITNKRIIDDVPILGMLCCQLLSVLLPCM